MFISRLEIIDKINAFSARKKPFLFAVDFKGEKGFVLSPEEASGCGIRYSGSTAENGLKSPARRPFTFDFFPVDFKTYEKGFEKVRFHLQRGDTYLLNLTFPTRIETDLSPEEIFSMSRAPFRLFVPGHFSVFSPESFVRIENGMIFSCPMKGTISAGVPDAENKLLADEKELYEHHTIVDLIRNDLSMVSTGVRVTRFRYIDRIRTHRGELLQMSSEISGNLPRDYRDRLGEILFALLPAGSVTGAPKEKTVRIIRETETYDRGFYTGIFGSFDGSTLSTAVAIRFIEETAGGLVFKSGGGITALSNAKSEYEELLEKIYVPVA